MGEVYKARDTRLDRIVAIKVCREQFSERFEREARAVAALNHSNICTLYDVGSNYLVMEYLDGSPLKGPLPLDRALKYASQICDALDAAHKKGITHRDLKPGNILLTKSGIKLLDFGLAKIGGAATPASDATVTMALTGKNEIVGTLCYMSPEQLQSQGAGKEIDSRSDIFSFGAVLYEMLTGKRAFDGASPASVVAAIMGRPAPSISAIAPASLDRLLQRCLSKDPDDRWQTARDLRAELEWIAATPVPAVAPVAARRWLVPALVSMLVAVTVFAAILLNRKSSTPGSSGWRVSLAPPPDRAFVPVSAGPATPEISPDGTMVVAQTARGLLLRHLNSTDWIPLGRGQMFGQPFWSPDSKFIGFYIGYPLRLMKLRVPDGVPEVICDIHSPPRGGAWSLDGQILFGSDGMNIVPVSGGDAVKLLGDNDRPWNAQWPHFLPDGEHFLFNGYDPKAPEGAVGGHGIYLAGWKAGKWTLRPVRLTANPGEARFSPLLGGSVLFVREDNLYAQHLDLAGARLDGESQLILRGVASGPMLGTPYFSVSGQGALAWRPGKAALAQLTWFDRTGQVLSVTGKPDAWQRISVSSDERHIVAVAVRTDTNELYVMESGKTGSQRLAPSEAERLMGDSGLWIPGTNNILYVERSGPKSFLMRQSASGSEYHPLGPWRSPFLRGFGADGKQFLISDGFGGKLFVASFPPDSSAPLEVSRGTANHSALSPDGKWVAYAAEGKVYAKQIGDSVPPRQIGTPVSPATFCAWRGHGKEILYSALDGQIWSVAADPNHGQFSEAVPLFKVRWPIFMSESSLLAASRDGSRILAAQAPEQPGSDVIHLMPDWTAALKQR